MKLSAVLADIPYVSDNFMDVEIEGIEYNSKKIKTDYLFVALRGSKVNGHDYISDALAHGAIAIVGEEDREVKGFPYIKVEDLKKYLPVLARNFYGELSSRMTVIGITGTNGKTTTTYLVESILRQVKERSLVIGTINYRIGGVEYPAVNTTPAVLDIYKYMSKALKNSVSYCIMEVSSHSLELGRVEGIRFKVAAYTNLSHEHLDFHGDLESYALAKKKLFDSLESDAMAVINKDDKYNTTMTRDLKGGIIYYGLNNDVEIKGEIKSITLRGSDVNILYNNVRYPLHTELIGIHNIYNILCAFGIGTALNIYPERIIRGIEEVKVVPGRLERFETGREFSVFIDYAHTPDALQKVISGLRQLVPGRLIVVFGAGGDRDPTKRPEMGRVVTEMADLAVVTSDNPRTEDPQKIIDDIVGGIKKENYKVIVDRENAIKYAVEHAKAGDVILIAGKGHEQYQIIGREKRPYSDFEAVKKALRGW